MALQSTYREFLAAPHASFLADDTSLHHITTLKTINGSSAVLKHFKNPEFKFKEQEIIDVVEGPDSLAVIVETTLEFVTGGGPFLPGLDDNFLADRTVTIPIIHFVSFDRNNKVRLIRLSWDQGCLLKLIEVIGKTGRNWPIFEGKEQISLIVSNRNSLFEKFDVAGDQIQNDTNGIKSRKNNSNPTRDPHASLSLFVSRDQSSSEPAPVVVAPRSSAKPPPRNPDELFGSHDLEATSPINSRISRNQKKIPLRSSSGSQNLGSSRLFELEEQAPENLSERNKNLTKFKHFEFTDGVPNEGAELLPAKVKSTKNDSHWNFDDFVTPQKNVPSKVLRTNDVRHWGNSDDEVMGSPERVKKVNKPRKDAQTHFEFQDDGLREDERRIVGRPRGQGHNDGLCLYKDIFDGQNERKEELNEISAPSLANVKDRRKDFEAHFTMSDQSPGLPSIEKIPEVRAKVVKMMDPNWSSYDHSPTQKENPLNLSTSNLSRNGSSGKPLAEATHFVNNRSEPSRGIKTDGDGMGGKKGTGRSWGFGDDSDGEDEGGVNRPGKFRTGKQAGRRQPTGGDFWDF